MKKSKPTTSFVRTVLVFALLLLALLACRSTNQPKAPSWTKGKVLSDNEDHPSKITSDGTSVYFVTGGTVASRQRGTNNIKRVSLADGSVSVLVKGGERYPSSTLAVDDKYLYWSDGGNILRVEKEGGKGEPVVLRAPQPDEMLLDEANIFWLIWTGEGSPPQPIMYASKTQGAAEQLTPSQPPTTGLCLDGDFIYWMTGRGIRRIPKRGGEVTEFYLNPNKQPSLGLQQDADNFYFCQMNAKGHSALMKLNKKSGELTQIAPSINHTMEFVVDETSVYFFDEVPGTGSFGPVALRKVSKQGGEPVTLDQGEGGWLKYLAVDSKQIYFTNISKVYALGK